MPNANEDIKNEGAENTGEHKHHTWVGDLIEKIEEKIDNIDADFPLSGGEEPHHTTHHTQPEMDEDAEAQKEEEAHKKKSFLDSINSDFPLSGGEE